MKAKDLMTKDVLSVDKDERLDRVLDLMRKHRVSKMVVTERGALCGIVTDGDIADELGSIKNRGVPAQQLHATSAMRRRYATLQPDSDLGVILKAMVDDDAGILPVLFDKTCIGVVTASDLLHLVQSDQPLADIATNHVLAVQPSDRVIHARRLMLDHHVERLPVLDSGRVVGIVGEIDMAAGLARFKATVADPHQPAAIQRFLVEDIMSNHVVTATPETSAREAAKLMLEKDVGSLPLLRGDRLVGIVTRSDLLKLVKT